MTVGLVARCDTPQCTNRLVTTDVRLPSMIGRLLTTGWVIDDDGSIYCPTHTSDAANP